MPANNHAVPLAASRLDPTAAEPLYRQLYEALRKDILAGHLPPGQRLAPSRVLADELGVSRNTVLVAFDLLLAEGYLESRVGAGTYVSEDLPEHLLHAETPTIAAAPSEPDISFTRRAQQFLTLPTRLRPEAPRPFRTGQPALDLFPFDVWARLTQQQIRQLSAAAYTYGDPAGYLPLREAIAAYLHTSRGIRCTAQQVIVVSGAQQGLNLMAQVLADEGDAAWLEDPAYLGTRAALLTAGLRPVPVPVDAEGIRVDAGKDKAPDARLVCVTPSYQYPLGMTMSLARRLRLLAWAGEVGAWILEDDYDNEYRYAGRPLAALKALDTDGRVLYLGTFSKALFPALRLGYLVVPPPLVEAFARARYHADRQSPVLEQAVTAQFLAEGHFARHVRRMRVVYAARQKALVEAVARELKGKLTVHAADGGMHLIGWLPDGVDDAAIVAEAEKAGIQLGALSLYYLDPPERPGVLMGYAAYAEEEIERAVCGLGEVLEAFFR